MQTEPEILLAPYLAVAADAGVHESGVQVRGTEPPLLHHPWPEVLQDDIHLL